MSSSKQWRCIFVHTNDLVVAGHEGVTEIAAMIFRRRVLADYASSVRATTP
jgi:hypothetical protein